MLDSLPPFAQVDWWSCCPTSLRWAFAVLGFNVTQQHLTEGMIRRGVLVAEDGEGIVDKTGKGVAEYVNHSFGPLGFAAFNIPDASFVTAASLPGPYIMYGVEWRHWTAGRGFDRTRWVLKLANNADPLQATVRQVLSQQEYADLGPFHVVKIGRF